jgi:hypothetical protein
MTSIAAYYVLLATDAAQKAAAEASRAPRPSIADRLRTFLATFGARPQAARPA